ncbi:GDP-D-glucose phosphorylase 1 [Epargyreus clarus]|uniref:GDP-D-glucose phosphorylase 1 n=1 Tax=Epargyreus clarus TaxID=520877 RepID=UPI003C307A19
MISDFAKEKVLWTKKMNLKLVKFMETKPHIWNRKHPKYTSVALRNKTYAEFADKYGNVFTGLAVKDRWTNIRTTFAYNLRKLTNSLKGDGEEYKINWHLWDACQFLRKGNQSLALSALENEHEESKDLTDTPTSDKDASEEEEFLEDNINGSISNMSCKSLANNLLDVFKGVQNDVFGLENTKHGKIGCALNPNRGTKRRLPQDFNNVCTPMDDDKFNFTKVPTKEIMFTLTKDNKESEKHAILINVSPLNRYHSLLCPSIYKRLPQIVSQDSLKLALEIMLFIEDRELKVAFNSQCAFASVNHLHYHLLFEHRTLPVEKAKCKQIKGSLYCLEDYIVPAFYFDVTQVIDEALPPISKLLVCLLQKSIPHNIFITLGQSIKDPQQNAIRVFIWPRKSCSGMMKLAAFSIAACELAGWFTMYDILEFEDMKREGLEEELAKWKYDGFNELCEEIKWLF